MGTVLIQACLPPKPAGDFDGFDPNLLPPTWLISAPVDRSVMRPAERDGELVADLAAERTGLRKAKMVGIGRLATADEAGLGGDEAKVLLSR